MPPAAAVCGVRPRPLLLTGRAARSWGAGSPTPKAHLARLTWRLMSLVFRICFQFNFFFSKYFHSP